MNNKYKQAYLTVKMCLTNACKVLNSARTNFDRPSVVRKAQVPFCAYAFSMSRKCGSSKVVLDTQPGE